ncbi:MAG: putative Tau tubulin kinase 1 [Streblomastix strix]|uniref:Putative Tau tubulin kinase 1 n=1 Tax=Streblomastix strix TaxID=222440 RepID=A0A5J4VKL1_9EUKA|nr:MAG: putative Tau tubulin kinase 1 [Streblomastix strix]
MLEICPSFQSGDINKNRYTIVEQIGKGSYSAIFEGINKNQTASQHVAIKFEQITLESPTLLNEILVLQELAGNIHFAQFYEQGTHKKYKFVAMELLGPSLNDLVNRKKPNFVIGSTVETSNMIYLIDFGLCKKLYLNDGIIINPSMKGSFHGTIKYASINAHLGKELGRNDDLMSLIYILVELYTGTLPWGNVNDPDEVLRLKELYQGGSLLVKMPSEFKHIKQLN